MSWSILVRTRFKMVAAVGTFRNTHTHTHTVCVTHSSLQCRFLWNNVGWQIGKRTERSDILKRGRTRDSSYGNRCGSSGAVAQRASSGWLGLVGWGATVWSSHRLRALNTWPSCTMALALDNKKYPKSWQMLLPTLLFKNVFCYSIQKCRIKVKLNPCLEIKKIKYVLANEQWVLPLAV